MNGIWLFAGASFAVAFLLLAPFVFERYVREARFLSSTFDIKFDQHLFPGRQPNPDKAQFLRWLAQKELWIALTPDSIGKRAHAIRQLTGADNRGHLLALGEAGLLIHEISAAPWISPRTQHCEKPVEALEVIKALLPLLTSRVSLDNGQDDIRRLLVEARIDLGQLVEVLLAVVDILEARIEADRLSPSTQADR